MGKLGEIECLKSSELRDLQLDKKKVIHSFKVYLQLNIAKRGKGVDPGAGAAEDR